MRFSCLLGLLAGSAWSCYEIPPSLPEGYVGSAPEAPGWPPPAAYDPEPLHPLNRWFQRAFSARDFSGHLKGVDAAEPLPAWASLSSVDRAELAALTETLVRERLACRAGAGRPATTNLVLRSDALQVAARLEAEDSSDDASRDASRRLVRLLLEVARGPGVSALEGRDPEIEPPPLRQGKWLELDLEVGTGLEPEPLDLRWTRILCTKGGLPRRSWIVFSRLRIILGPDGEPQLVPLSSECWEAEVSLEETAWGNVGGRGSVEAKASGEDGADGEPGRHGEAEAVSRESPSLRLWRWDRARWAAGGDPWRECEPKPGAGPGGRGPGLEEAFAEAPRVVAAGRCREYASLSPPEAMARAQLERAREALRHLPGAADPPASR